MNRRTRLRPNALTPAERQALVLSVVRWVYRLAARYARGSRTPVEDMVSAGFEGAAYAASVYDPGRGIKFDTYATWWIRQRMQKEIAGARVLGFTHTGGRYRNPDWRPAVATAPDRPDGKAPVDFLAVVGPGEPGVGLDWELLTAALTEREREVAALRYVMRLNNREIARELGVSYQRVGQLHLSMGKRLRETFPGLRRAMA